MASDTDTAARTAGRANRTTTRCLREVIVSWTSHDAPRAGRANRATGSANSELTTVAVPGARAIVRTARAAPTHRATILIAAIPRAAPRCPPSPSSSMRMCRVVSGRRSANGPAGQAITVAWPRRVASSIKSSSTFSAPDTWPVCARKRTVDSSVMYRPVCAAKVVLADQYASRSSATGSSHILRSAASMTATSTILLQNEAV